MAERSNDPKSLDLGKQFDPKKFKLEIKTAEDPAELNHRLRKEFFSFLVKDLCTYGVAILIVRAPIASFAGTRNNASEETGPQVVIHTMHGPAQIMKTTGHG
ncbi:MAG: hypothetical protein ACHRXM_07200 [Isosphaerales bacterium]